MLNRKNEKFKSFFLHTLRMQPSKKRGKFEIMANILEIAKKPTAKTRIMYRANLSFSQLEKYLKEAEKSRLLEKKNDSNSITYQTTERGEEFLESWYAIIQILDYPRFKLIKKF